MILEECGILPFQRNIYPMPRHTELSKAIHLTADRAFSAERPELGGIR